MILVIVAFFRELFGSGTLLGYQIVPENWYIANGGGYSNNGLMLFPADGADHRRVHHLGTSFSQQGFTGKIGG